MVIFKRILTLTLAVTITSTAMAMAVASGLDRGGTAFDQSLFIAIAVSVTVLTHLLPALSNNKIIFVLWAGCLLATIFGQMVYFTHAAERAGNARLEKVKISERVRSLEIQIADATVSRDSIIARPLAVVARDYAVETGYRARTALKLELAEAKRKISLDNLIASMRAACSTERDSEHDSTSRDSIVTLLSVVTGASGETISLIVSVAFAMLIELAGTALWVEILNRRSTVDVGTTDSAGRVVDFSGGELKGNLWNVKRLEPQWNSKPEVPQAQPVFAPVEEPQATIETDSKPQRDEELFVRLQQAVASGACKRTQNSIRLYLGCSQRKAGEFNKLLQLSNTPHM